ncbi:Yip1 family protein [Alkalihalobacillus sp. AL-G]|uniref:Yip1 family protein n=1 Tax=Alkalihalobacillus sp. AL-G TaxID=2926399 RepID=UPI00272B76CF|nr:Yip1 family protein [Alkalihalobacillus sp. AL-G]WLD93098.1 YIP1 family protein [Alkalihalobacillus sp. AL-G]
MNQENLRPLLTLWVKPRETTRQILDSNNSKFYICLVILAGISGALNNAVEQGAGDEQSFPFTMILAMILGILGGLLSWYIVSLILYWTGTWIGGEATREQIKIAFGWSNFYIILTMLLWIINILMFGQDLFTSENQNSTAIMYIGILELIIGIWSFIVLVKMIAEAQHFSVWKGLGNILLTILVVMVPLAILGGIISLLILSF